MKTNRSDSKYSPRTNTRTRMPFQSCNPSTGMSRPRSSHYIALHSSQMYICQTCVCVCTKERKTSFAKRVWAQWRCYRRGECSDSSWPPFWLKGSGSGRTRRHGNGDHRAALSLSLQPKCHRSRLCVGATYTMLSFEWQVFFGKQDNYVSYGSFL
jgi:hypothetical protein